MTRALPPADRISSLLARLARLDASGAWADGLNPTQRAVLIYLSQANLLSHAPSHVADYLGATRGTVSQTLKALLRKGLVDEVRSQTDLRSIRYDLTADGRAAIARPQLLTGILAAAPQADVAALSRALEDLLAAAIAANGQRSFGICRTCRHFVAASPGGQCGLLNLPLAPAETGKLCHEHAAT